ncbi:MAG: protein kinase, partial [Proteobacteria bacterium]|nr:protein kinase [Pseudomonadota bacterium]
MMTSDHLNALPVGFRFEEHEIIRVLGSGGFGITYLGYDHNLYKPVAIKEYLPNDLAVRQDGTTVLPKSSADKEDFEWGLERFLDEARTLAKFDHRNIIKVSRFFRAHETGYIVMEYAEGKTLSELLKEKHKLSEDEVWAILEPLLKGLEVVHKNEYLHRDIKPGNIIIRDDGSPVLIDFGSARQALGAKSRSITAIVSPGYAPLEQYSEHSNQGPWTDIYALGAVAYKCLTGKIPPDATVRIKDDPYIPVHEASEAAKPSHLLKAVDIALAPDPDDRPKDITDWLALLRGRRIAAERAAGKKARRQKKPSEISQKIDGLPKLAIAAALVLVVGATAYFLWPASEAPAPSPAPTELAETEPPASEFGQPALIRQAQGLLNQLDYEVGPPSGEMSTRTIGAVRSFETDENLIETGEVDTLLIDKLMAALDRKDDAAWQEALAGGTEVEIAKYQEDWSDGRHLSEVDALLDRLAWETAKAAKSIPALEAYREIRPEGAFVGEVMAEIQEIEAEQGAAWAEAGLEGTIEAYEAFIDIHPASKYVAAARQAISEIMRLDEEGAWVSVQRRDRIPAYETYKENYPSGKYVQAANEAIARLKIEAQETAWAEARQIDTAAAYEAYLEAYPRGRFVIAANQAISAVAVREEEAAWSEAKRLDTVAAYEAYKAAYPQGKFRSEANQAVEAVAVRKEETAWAEAQRLDTVAAYEIYKKAYPRGKFRVVAEQAIAAVAVRQHEAAWAEAQRADSVAGYEAYKAAYPKGKFLAEAEAAIKLLSDKVSRVERAAWKKLQANPTVANYRSFLREYPRGANANKARKFFEPYPVTWERVLGGMANDAGTALAILSGGGIAVAGWTESKGAGGADVWILKFDEKGKTIWEHTRGGPGDENATAIVELPQGELAIAGWRKAKGSKTANMLVGKMDASGNTIWERTYSSNGNEYAAGLVVLANGRLAVAGVPRDSGRKRSKMRLVKISTTGNISWQLTFDTTITDRFGALAALADGGLAVATSTTYQRDHQDLWILRLDRSGKQVWGKAFGGQRNEYADAIVALKDGGFLVAGRIEGDRGSSDEIQIIKLDRSGNPVWERIFSGIESDGVKSLAVLPDGTIVAAGRTRSGGAG